MEVLFEKLNPAEVYFTLIQTLIPRPVAWVLSENIDGRFNLAPFSYFIPVSSDPPLVILSLGKKPGGALKDTCVNISARQDFVIHIASRSQMEALNASSETLPSEVSEVEMLGLKTIPFGAFRLPRVADCPIAFACRLYEIREIGNAPQALIFGEILSVYMDDGICEEGEKGRVRVAASRLDPLVRLGADDYAGLGEIISLARPK